MSRTFLSVALFLLVVATGISQENPADKGGKLPRRGLKEPLHRISKARIESNVPAKADATVRPEGDGKTHPLDPAIEMARQALQRIQSSVTDYSCTLVKQERIDGELLPQEYIYTEIRNRKVENGKITTPLSVYMYFLKPEAMKGREVIYVEGANEGKLMAHEAGLLGKIGVVKLDPRGHIAMRGQRYPITDIGIEFLISELIKRGERDRQRDECTVDFKQGVKINGRGCTMLEVIHPQARPHFDFHVARVYIDDELNLPLRYEAYTWPTVAGGKPVLQECYTYLNLKLNIGLTDDNFDAKRIRL